MPTRFFLSFPFNLLMLVLLAVGVWGITRALPAEPSQLALVAESSPAGELNPAAGVVLPVRWGNLGARLVAAGVIDRQKFDAIYASRGGLGKEELALLEGAENDTLVMTPQNAGFLLNLLWAFGLANENSILTEGPMSDPRYGGAGNFASTGGWTLARGGAMEHYSAHPLVALTPTQQALVEKTSQNIYRPCCGNSTYFPDCNHGMAMLGLLELLAAQNLSEDEMYRLALQVNAYWFPDTYETIARYLAGRGLAWADAVPKEILGADYSSGSGYQRILAQIEPPRGSGGASCGV